MVRVYEWIDNLIIAYVIYVLINECSLCIDHDQEAFGENRDQKVWVLKIWQHLMLQCLENRVGTYKLIQIVYSQKFVKLNITRIVVTWNLNWVIIQALFGVANSVPRWLCRQGVRWKFGYGFNIPVISEP